MKTLELQLDDDLQDFVQRQSQMLGHASIAAYIESLLSLERLRKQSSRVDKLLKAAEQDPTQTVDDDYWKRLEAEMLDAGPADAKP